MCLYTFVVCETPVMVSFYCYKHRLCYMDGVCISCNLLCVLLLIQCFQLILQLTDLLLQAACLSLRQCSEMHLWFRLLFSGFAQCLNTRKHCILKKQKKKNIGRIKFVHNNLVPECGKPLVLDFWGVQSEHLSHPCFYLFCSQDLIALFASSEAVEGRNK